MRCEVSHDKRDVLLDQADALCDLIAEGHCLRFLAGLATD